LIGDQPVSEVHAIAQAPPDATAALSAACLCNLMAMNRQETGINSEKSTAENKKYSNV
jgi:hypothetical protein